MHAALLRNGTRQYKGNSNAVAFPQRKFNATVFVGEWGAVWVGGGHGVVGRGGMG